MLHGSCRRFHIKMNWIYSFRLYDCRIKRDYDSELVYILFSIRRSTHNIAMRTINKCLASLFLISIILSSVYPCGPSFIEPLFDTTNGPEAPYRDYAAGQLGIVKPQFRRSVLIGAYRYIAGNGLTAPEQSAMIDVWNAEFHNRDYRNIDVEKAVKDWVAKRKGVGGDEEKLPEIYVEREYGGYDFFPNCAQNAFEVATETLDSRASSHGPQDVHVKDWIKAQDQVFENCSSGRNIPNESQPGAPEWSVRDRKYQIAAAKFYSLDYDEARRGFAEIASDTGSPWSETADYLVGRTMVRQASLSNSNESRQKFYGDAEEHLEKVAARRGRFSDAAENLIGLVKFRTKPNERLVELAKMVINGGSETFRQQVIDYTWLMDRAENSILTLEQKRKEAERRKAEGADDNKKTPPSTDRDNTTYTPPDTPEYRVRVGTRQADNEIEVNIYLQGGYIRIFIDPNANDDEAVAKAESVFEQSLTDEGRQRVREARRSAYASRYNPSSGSGFEGRYYGDEAMSVDLLPEYLRADPMTEWIFIYQLAGDEAFRYSMDQLRSNGSELWLMTAIAKATASSAGLSDLLKAAESINSSSFAYATIEYHRARLLIETGKKDDAKRLIDQILGSGDMISISTRNAFLDLRRPISSGLDDYLRFSLKRAYAFDYDREPGSIDELIARQKTYFNEEYNPEGREAYERSIDEQFALEKLWQTRELFDNKSVGALNRYFSTKMLSEVERSSALPDYFREQMASVLWMRAWVLGDRPTMDRVQITLKKEKRFEPYIEAIETAPNAATKANAELWFVLKNPILAPFLEYGLPRSDNNQNEWDMDDWWCAPYERENEDGESSPEEPRPAFLTPADIRTASAEFAKIKQADDAPKFLGRRVLEWAKRTPADKRVPEALYITARANEWSKYGCGNDEELKKELLNLLLRKYPNSEWAAKARANQEEGK